MPVAIHRLPIATPADKISTEPATPKTLGLLFVIGLPAIFWAGVAAAVAHFTSFSISASAIAAIGAGIALILTIVCAPLMLRP